MSKPEVIVCQTSNKIIILVVITGMENCLPVTYQKTQMIVMRQNENRDILLLLTYLSEESIKQICEQYVYLYRTEEVLGLSFLMTTQCA